MSDISLLEGTLLADVHAAWEPRDVILYHLALGAGVPPDSAAELEYAYEAHLKVLPTMVTTSAQLALSSLTAIQDGSIPQEAILHGEHTLRVTRPLPSTATVVHSPRIGRVYDKGSGALLTIHVDSHDGSSNQVLASNTFGLFIRGAGNFGGDPGEGQSAARPQRACDELVVVRTLPQQALLYRLTGDRNPMHADPDFASRAGFPRPILHGLCTFGMVLRAVVERQLNGDVGAVTSYSGRFAGPVFPGESLEVQLWDEGGGRIVVFAAAGGPPRAVLTGGEVIAGPF